MGVAELRRDGFTSVSATGSSAVLTTHPVRFDADRTMMFVNVEGEAATLKVAILDAQTLMPLPELAAGAPKGEGERVAVGFPEAAIRSIASRPVRVRFTFESSTTRLWSAQKRVPEIVFLGLTRAVIPVGRLLVCEGRLRRKHGLGRGGRRRLQQLSRPARLVFVTTSKYALVGLTSRYLEVHLNLKRLCLFIRAKGPRRGSAVRAGSAGTPAGHGRSASARSPASRC